MARPLKIGLDYFPHDVDASSDEKIERLRAQFKNDGYSFYFMMLERIYRTNDGRLLLDETAKKIFAKRMGLSLKKFSEILNCCLKNFLFSQDEFEKNSVITSQGIQKRFFEIQAERERKRDRYYQKREVSPVVSPVVSPDKTPGEMGGETPQSKVKKSKALKEDQFEQFWKLYPNSGLGNKGSKQDARNEFMKLDLEGGLFDIIVAALNKQIIFKRKLKDRGKFYESFPHAVRWIKKKRWEDEATEPNNILDESQLEEKRSPITNDIMTKHRRQINGEA
ncbi:MAG TPA: DUF4373 domain-containing protein [Melioribacteraceae bacterium]|nr:DUF4373 domain-containing protein [Melioribacteraceae bacterium]